MKNMNTRVDFLVRPAALHKLNYLVEIIIHLSMLSPRGGGGDPGDMWGI